MAWYDLNIITNNIFGRPTVLPHHNKRPHKSYQELLCDTQIAQIWKVYQDDFLLLNY